MKRKYDELQQDRDELQGLVTLLTSKNEREAYHVFRRVRAGQDARSILGSLRHGDPLAVVQIPTSPDQRRAGEELIRTLMRSNASLEEAVDFIDMIRNAPNLHIPTVKAQETLRSRLNGIKSLRALVDQANPRTRISIADLLVDNRAAEQHSPLQSPYTLPESSKIIPFRVPAAPWTYLTNDDELVSHLVSLFLVWTNSALRFVEEDLFLEAMRSGDLESDYCSPLLVHSILALGSVSEYHTSTIVTS